MTETIKDRIKTIVEENDVVLFMKGEANSPICGFSSVVCQILKKLNVQFVGVNVLADEQIRQGIKDYSNWPTIPQLYIKQEFIGGCDITKEMYQSGELQELLRAKNLL